MTERPLDVFFVIGEPSGDQLGFKLMRALREQQGGAVRFRGVAGPAMEGEGMASLFPLDDIAVMGFASVAARFRTIYRRAWQTIDAILAQPPDVLVLIDSPDFTHAVAKRVRRRLPALPVVDYVSPSVWAWRPGRARRMRAYIDLVLALLPFEPEAYRRLQGPRCVYVGHPLIERLDELRPGAEDEARRDGPRPTVLALPGSRSGEVARMTGPMGEAFALAARQAGPFEIVLPAASRRVATLREMTRSWPVKPLVVEGEAEKLSAFRRARAALATSGTVTLELALAQVPTVGAYRMPGWEAFLARRLVQVPTVLLPNLILGEAVVPELLQEEATPEKLAAALVPLIEGGAARDRQMDAFRRLDALMSLPQETPSQRAARLVVETARGEAAPA